MKKIVYAAFASTLLLATSCVDLDQNPKSFITEEEYIETPKDAASVARSVTGLYNDLWKENYGFNCRIMRINVMADDIIGSPTKSGNVLNYYSDLNPNLFANNDDFAGPWAGFYTTIINSNKIINGTPFPTGVENEAKIKELQAIVGEAYFVRGLCYFYVARMFGDAPLILDNKTVAINQPRVSVAELYEKAIVPSMQQAVAWLPTTSRTKTSASPTLWAAKACLADIYMTMAGWPLKKGTEYYAKAATETQEIITGAGLSLTKEYSDLWKEALKGDTNEHLFAMHHSAAQKVPSQYGKSFYPTDFYPKAGWADYYGNETFMLKYPEGKRKQWNYMLEWPVAKDKTVNYKQSRDGMPCISKYYDYNEGVPGNSAQSNGITPFYRYADVLLMYAEASNLATNSVNSLALQCLQEVQTRAGVATITTTKDSKAFDDAVFAERGWEFVAEFKRWFDLVRREKVSEVKPKEYAASLFKANNHYYLPIPYVQIDMTGWKNNAGY
ncbi:RagB/SusD family nutrient uptake outer membrane protein [Bacteroides sp.]|uniref:RagB/SusD family nutrient uptake outer membrane protein n=1 Tax=Bacteroides sp. TaxID=29523 RepID=UPI001B40731F|nr:RagB/SusD family nutrient uptake outer membrane protein [Bacteroides sp.]MBP6064496.1 RagB/SusD family nutrient uptake outer membrane protein [Bacteroides sp.]MBP6935507.1 RagB/SusD family nutrient uptake outer membrane protein [Bacteroides sp.]